MEKFEDSKVPWDDILEMELNFADAQNINDEWTKKEILVGDGEDSGL